jgi:uncharacterized HAD superfamily protein
MKVKTIVVDLDGVICEERRTFERPLADEIEGARLRLEEFVHAGHTVIIHTARGWQEFAVTRQWLYDHAMPFHTLVMGKPVADIVVDDRAVRSLEDAVNAVG